MRILRPMIWLISLVLVVSLTRSVAVLLEKRGIVEEQRQQVARLQEENARLTQELSQADTPEFIEREAREKLGLVKEGETIVILPKAEGEGERNMQEQSTWQQWWALFF